MKIYIRELYVEKEDMNSIIEWFLTITSKIKKRYFCRYENDTNKKYFIRIGFIDPQPQILKRFDELCKNHFRINKVKSWQEHPKTKEWDMELMKFQAFNTYLNLRNHFLEYKDYYKNSKMRARDIWGRPNKPEDRTKMFWTDWAHFIHHVYNMMGYDYATETWLYNMLEAGIHYNAHISTLKS